MKCSQCGKEIPADSEFCAYCGASATPAGTAAGTDQAASFASPVAPPPPMPSPPAHPSGGPGQAGATPPTGSGYPPGQYGPPAKKSPLPWILGIIGLLFIAAVVLVLVLVVFKGDGGGADKGPENTVEAFFESLEKQDARMLIDTMEPSFAAEIKEILGEDYIDLLDEYFFTYFPEGFEVNIEETYTTIDGDTAEVLITEGTLSYREDGETVTEEAADADLDAFELIKVDGVWYLEEDFLVEIGFDFRDLEDYDSDDMDLEYLDLEDLGYEDPRDNDYDMEISLPIDSKIEAFNVVLEDDEISDWYWEAFLPQFDISDEETSYIVYLYELDEDYNYLPYGNYAVDKDTGEMYEVVE
jgi:hypothetical protein